MITRDATIVRIIVLFACLKLWLRVGCCAESVFRFGLYRQALGLK
jgi:hypothetical protein